MLRIGSVVTHSLFVGPGTVVAFHEDQQGQRLIEVFWQSLGKNGMHSDHNLKLMTASQTTAQGKEF